MRTRSKSGSKTSGPKSRKARDKKVNWLKCSWPKDFTTIRPYPSMKMTTPFIKERFIYTHQDILVSFINFWLFSVGSFKNMNLTRVCDFVKNRFLGRFFSILVVPKPKWCYHIIPIRANRQLLSAPREASFENYLLTLSGGNSYLSYVVVAWLMICHLQDQNK